MTPARATLACSTLTSGRTTSNLTLTRTLPLTPDPSPNLNPSPSPSPSPNPVSYPNLNPSPNPNPRSANLYPGKTFDAFNFSMFGSLTDRPVLVSEYGIDAYNVDAVDAQRVAADPRDIGAEDEQMQARVRVRVRVRVRGP